MGPSPIEAVLLIDRLERSPGHRAATSSLPGHLIQLTLRGRTQHEANGRHYVLRTGDLIWYHEDETVRVAVEEAYAFYTLNFIAPRLAPPPFERRVRRVGAPVRRAFTELLRVWRDLDAPSASRDLSVHSRLPNCCIRLPEQTEKRPRHRSPTTLWLNCGGDWRPCCVAT